MANRLQMIIQTASKNPTGKPNKAFIDALYLEFHGRKATPKEYEKFSQRTIKDAANIIAGKEIIKFQSRPKTFYRVGKNIFNSQTNKRIPETEWKNNWSGKATEIQRSPENVDELIKLNSEIDARTDLTPGQKAILKEIASKDYTSGQKIPNMQELQKIIDDASRNVEADITPYYKRITGREIEDVRRQMAQIRNEAANYAAREKLDYLAQVKKTKEALRSRGLTFSGLGREYLGSEGIVPGNGVEGIIPQTRKLSWNEKLADWQNRAAKYGVPAERKLGLERMNNLDLGKIQTPYGEKTLYQPTGTDITTGKGDIYTEKLGAIEKEKWNRISKYRPFI